MDLAEIFSISNAHFDDYNAIHELFRSRKIQYFGKRKRKSTSANTFFSHYMTHRMLVRVSASNPTIIGYAEVTNTPCIPALPEDSWMDWLNFHYYCDLPLSVINTCFFNTFIYHKDYNPQLIKQVLCEIFYREYKLRFIVIPQCPIYGFYLERNQPNYYCLEPFATVFYPKCFSCISSANTPKLHVVLRDTLMPQMIYRKALPEDNDDIVEILHVDRPDLKEQLGDFYIAEELLSNSTNLLIVTEISHKTAGFIWLNDNVNVLTLLKNYELEQFGNLIKCNTKENYREKQIFVNSANRSPLDKLFVTEFVKKIYQSIEIKTLDNISNFSFCSDNINSINGHTTTINKKKFLKKLKRLEEKIKSHDYYVQLRKRKYGVIYNIFAPFDAKTNAFVIHLFGLVDAYDTRRIFRFLFTSFAAFPDKDYCLLSVNVANQMTASLFEMLKFFIRVTPRPGCSIDENLYITHRSAVYGDLSLFAVRIEDVSDIKKILSDEIPELKTNKTDSIQEDFDKVLAILNNIFEDPFSEYKCFTIRCGNSTRPIDENTILGFVIVRPFHFSSYLKKHFHVAKRDEFINLMMAELLVLKLHLLFHFQADLVFRELARQSNYCHFFYFQATNHHCLSNDLLMKMQPLEPRRIKKKWFCNFNQLSPLNSHSTDNIHLNKSTKSSGLDDNPIDLLNHSYAAFEHNLHPSIYFGNSTNIVILGFTDICKAFLRLMIFSWHSASEKSKSTINCLPHVNITVICSPGIMEAEHEHSFKCDTCCRQEDCWVNFQNSDDFIKDVCHRMNVRNWIRFVSGKVDSINTENKLIKLDSECEIYYETLLLMCGTEFGTPKEIFDNTPSNYSHINNRFDKLVFYHKLMILKEDLPEHFKKSIVVYGKHIKTFEFINFLLKHGIKGEEIHLVMPHKSLVEQTVLKLNNSMVDLRIEEIAREMIEDSGVCVYDCMNLVKFNLHEDNENLKEVVFLNNVGDPALTLKCDLFISFNETFIDGSLLKILEEAYLAVNESHVIVDHNYQTSDSNIYAIGNFIKPKIEPNHQYHFVSPQEAAEKIINILGLIDGEEEDMPVFERKFSKPHYFQAQLPQDYLFTKVTIPKRYLANYLDIEYGCPLFTYCEGDFTRVRLNEHGKVEEIVVVTRKKLDFDFLKFFCGRHELLLNNLKSRWYLKDIINFIDFFQEPWVELLMHDKFENLRSINKILINTTAQEIMKREDLDRESRHNLMRSYCQDLGVTSQLEFALLEFLREHREDFYSEIALPEDFPNYNKEQEF